MNARQELESRRKDVVERMLAIRSMRKGTISEQWVPIIRDGKKTGERRGPYPVFTCKVNGRTVSERLKGDEALARAREEVDNYRRFRDLYAELEELTVALGEVDSRERDGEEQLKKKPGSRSNKARKSRG
jgi:transposase